MARISQHIDHHAKRIALRTKEIAGHVARKAAHHARQRKIITVVLLLAIILCSLYFIERHQVQSQDIRQPIQCTKLIFTANSALCEEVLKDAYAFVPPLQRNPVCNMTRSLYGVASVCDEYDAALAQYYYAAPLQEHGVSIWEPSEKIVSNGTLHIRIAANASDVYLICDKILIPSVLQDDALLLHAKINGTCDLIAKTDQGSMTSLPFVLEMD